MSQTEAHASVEPERRACAALLELVEAFDHLVGLGALNNAAR